jgi:hypothetical protein
MKKTLLMLLPMLVAAKVHYAKVEPIERATIKATVSGIVTHANRNAEGSELTQMPFVQIDDVLDRENLKKTETSIKLFKESLEINQAMLEGLKSSLSRQEDFYLRMSALETASQTQKDNAYSAYIGAKNQYLGTREKIINLKKQILDLKYKRTLLKDTIAKKHIAFPGKYLYKLVVHEGEFATPGLPIAIVDDISQAQLILYLDADEITSPEGDSIQDKQILINGQPTNLKIDRIWKVADTQYVSAYKARIILPANYPFSSLLKIEFK